MYHETLVEMQRRERAKKSLLAFLEFVWWMPEPFKVGRHIRALCAVFDEAIRVYLSGQSVFLLTEVCFGQGKSFTAVAAAAYFLARCAERTPGIIFTGYEAGLVEEHSMRVQNIVASQQFNLLYPNITLDGSRPSVGHWRVRYDGLPSPRWVLAAGLGGGLTGRRYTLGICDDPIRGRVDAESEQIRANTWQRFTQDYLSRRFDPSITWVIGTPWHVDDPIARIKQQMKDNPQFPKFKIIRFPYRKDEWVEPTNPRGYLFPEVYSPDWYETQRGAMGPYGAAALMDCNPTIRGGNMFQVDGISYVDQIGDFPQCRYARAWDLASTEKQRIKDSPDLTVGLKGGLTYSEKEPHLWISDMVYGQMEAPERDKLFDATTDRDGAAVPVGIECVAGYKDTWSRARERWLGQRTIEKITVHRDLVLRSDAVAPIFAAGNVHVLRAPWNDVFYNHIVEFPSGAHDDVVAALCGLYEMLVGHEQHTICPEFSRRLHVINDEILLHPMWKHYVVIYWMPPDPFKMLAVSHDFNDQWWVWGERIGRINASVEECVAGAKTLAGRFSVQYLLNPIAAKATAGVDLVSQLHNAGVGVATWQRKRGDIRNPDGSVLFLRELLKDRKIKVLADCASLINGLWTGLWVDGSTEQAEADTGLGALLGVMEYYRVLGHVPTFDEQTEIAQMMEWARHHSRENKLVKERDALNRPKPKRRHWWGI